MLWTTRSRESCLCTLAHRVIPRFIFYFIIIIKFFFIIIFLPLQNRTGFVAIIVAYCFRYNFFLSFTLFCPCFAIHSAPAAKTYANLSRTSSMSRVINPARSAQTQSLTSAPHDPLQIHLVSIGIENELPYFTQNICVPSGRMCPQNKFFQPKR